MNDFLDGMLSATQSVSLQEHARDCAACRREMDALRATQALLLRAPVPPSRDALARTLARFERAAAMHASARRTAYLPARAARTALAAGAAAVVLWAAVHGRSPIAPHGPAVQPAALAPADVLPSVGELNEMVAQHAAASPALLSSVPAVHPDALADAAAHVEPVSLDDAP